MNVFRTIFYEGLGSFFLVFCFFLLMWDSSISSYIFAPSNGGILASLSLYLLSTTGAGINPLRVLSISMITGKYHNVGILLSG